MEAIGVLAGGVAHEFNNILMGVSGYVELLRKDFPGNEKTDRYLQQMAASTQRMAQLTNQLLAYARGGKYHSEAIKVNDLVEDTISLIRRNMEPAIRIEVYLSEDVLSIVADRTQIQMALTAILSNAEEAIDGQGLIRIVTRNEVIDEEFAETHTELTEGPYICLKIIDDGKGMDEETRKKIFEPFFTTNFQGRGLGMAAAYGIVKNHKGAIIVDSELDKGTQVRIYLPASREISEVLTGR
jgi:signal transduction histidine kinase